MANTTETATFNVDSNLGDVSKDAKNAAGNLSVMGISLNTVKAGFKSASASAKLMFGSVKAGLISTGIGAFVLLIVGLIQYFKDSEEGASKFKQITAQLGVVIGNVTDIVSNLGKSFFALVTGDIKGFKMGLDEVTEGVKNFGETTRKEMAQANQLEKDRLALQKFERVAIVEKAKTEKDMMELRLKARDFEKFAAEERLEFMREANKLAAEQLEKDLHVAKEKLRFQVEENSFSKSSQANLDAEANLQAAVFNLERSNFSERKRLKSEEQAIVKEIAASNKKIAADRQKIIDDEFAALVKLNAERFKGIEKLVDVTVKANEELILSDNSVLDNYLANNEKRKQSDEAMKVAKLGVTSAIGGAISALGNLMAEGTASSKAAALAEIAISTGVGIVQGLDIAQKSAKAAGPAAALAFPLFYATQLAAVLGAAAKAKSVMGAGGGVDNVTVPSTTSSIPAPQMMSGAFDLSGGVAPDPVQAFVLTDEMTNSQNQLANIRRRATI